MNASDRNHVIFDYHAQRAIDILRWKGLRQGSQTVISLGLEQYLQKSSVETIAKGLAKSQTNAEKRQSGLSTSEITDLESTQEFGILGEMVEALSDYAKHLSKRESLSRREWLTLSGIVVAAACDKFNPIKPTETEKSEKIEPTIISGIVETLDKKMVTGTIQYLGKDGPVLATSAIHKGGYLSQIDNIKQVKRVRIYGEGICATERNFTLTTRHIVLDRKLAIGDQYPTPKGVDVKNPSFYDIVNRHETGRYHQVPVGLRKVVDPLRFFVDKASIGELVQNPQSRLEHLLIEVKKATFDLGIPFKELIVTSEPPAPGNGNVVMRFKEGYAFNTKFNKHRITGAQLNVAPNLHEGMIPDRAMLCKALLLISTSDMVVSMANDRYAQHQPSSADTNILVASAFETLGTRKAASFDDTIIESYEPMV